MILERLRERFRAKPREEVEHEPSQEATAALGKAERQARKADRVVREWQQVQQEIQGRKG